MQPDPCTGVTCICSRISLMWMCNLTSTRQKKAAQNELGSPWSLVATERDARAYCSGNISSDMRGAMTHRHDARACRPADAGRIRFGGGLADLTQLRAHIHCDFIVSRGRLLRRANRRLCAAAAADSTYREMLAAAAAARLGTRRGPQPTLQLLRLRRL